MNGFRRSRKVLTLPALLAAGFLTGCGNSDKTEEVHSFAVWEKTDEASYIFSDGVTAEKWKNEKEDTRQYRYRLENGTDLLETTDVLSPEDEMDSELSGFEGLSDTAKEKVRIWYQDQGLLYDLDKELEDAYQDYLECEKSREHFTCHKVSQDVTESAENAEYMMILTAVTTPKKLHFDGGTTCNYQTAIFNRSTGETIDLWSLFTMPEEEVKEELAKTCSVEDTTVSEQDVGPVMDQGQILLFQDYLEVWFPYGTWERQEFDKGFGFEYNKIEGLLYEWAVPQKEE